MMELIEEIVRDAEYPVSIQDALGLTGMDAEELIVCANRVRKAHRGNRGSLCSIVNAKSGSCSQDCAFCSQSARHRTVIDKYPLLPVESIVERALRMEEAGAANYSIVTSGVSLSDGEIEQVCEATRTIRERTRLRVCGSLGLLTADKALRLKQGGLQRYHHNLETARSHYPRICTTRNYDDNIATIRLAAAAGLSACSGGIFGMGEGWEERADLALELRGLPCDTIPVNFLNPIAGTRLENTPPMQPLEALKCIALLRIVNPHKSITVCGGREVVLKDFQSWVFLAGADGLMIGNYLTTLGRDTAADLRMARDAGIEI